MIAYKYRTTANLEYTLDILWKHRLRCTPWKNLNDPMEGAFSYELRDDPDQQRYVRDVIKGKAPYKVCALTSRLTSYLMWSHYSDGARGLAFEFEIHEIGRHTSRRGRRFEVAPVQYRDDAEFPLLNLDGYPDQVARNILLSKHAAWSYEGEIRVLGEDDFYEPIRLLRVIAGHRMKRELVDLFRQMCRAQQVPFSMHRVDPNRGSFLV